MYEAYAATLAMLASATVTAGRDAGPRDGDADPFAWLETGDAPEVQRWTAAQNAATRRALDPLPGRAALEQRLWSLYEIGSLGTPVSKPLSKTPSSTARKQRRYFYTRRDGKQNQPVLYVRDGLEGADRVLVDVNAGSPRRHARARLVVPLRRRRAGRLRRLRRRQRGVDAARARGGDRPRPRRRHRAHPGLLAGLDPRRQGLLLHPLPAAGRGGGGRDAVPPRASSFTGWATTRRKDRKLFGDGRDRTDWPGIDLSPDGRWLAITVSQGWAKSEIYLHDTRAGGADARPGRHRRGGPVSGRRPAGRSALPADDQRRAARADRTSSIHAHPARAKWREIIPESKGETGDVLKYAAYVKGGLAAVYLHDAASRLRRYDRDGAPRGEVALPGPGSVTGLSGRARRGRAVLFVHFVRDPDQRLFA